MTDSGGGREVGFWGSENSMGTVVTGANGIIIDGHPRDTDELIRRRTPICGRPIIPGRIEVVEVQTTIACGGVQVRPAGV